MGALLLSLLFALPGLAETWVVPSPPAPYSSDVHVLNTGAAPAKVRIGVDEREVAAGAVAALTGVQGVLRIDSDQPLVIARRAYSEAKFAHGIPAVPYDNLLTAGTTGIAGWANAASVAGVYAVVASEVEVFAFDAVGKQVAERRVAVEEGALVEIPLADLAPEGVRVEFDVVKGRVAAWVTVVDDTDALHVAAARPSTGRTATLIPAASVVRLTALEAGEVRVQVLGSDPLVLKLARGETREFASEGNLWIESARPVVAVARGAGEIRPSIDVESLSSVAQSLTRVRGDSVVTVAAWDQGARFDVAAYDADGNLIARSEAVEAGAYSILTFAPSMLFADLPAEFRLTLTVLAGVVHASAENFEESGDRSLGFAGESQPAACLAPVISGFSASPEALAAAGKVQLYWQADGADAVVLTPTGAAHAPSGSVEMSQSATTTYSIEAQNACGSATASLEVPLGAIGIASVTPRSAVPGQRVAVKPRNLADPQRVEAVVFAFNADLPVHAPVEEVNSAGEIVVRVPFVRTADAYRGGPVNVSLELDDATRSATAAFTILALPAATNAVTEFRTIVTRAQREAKASLAEARQIAGWSEAAAALESRVDQSVLLLTTALDQIERTGSADMPVDIPSRRYPSPDRVRVTRADIEQIMTLYKQYETVPDTVKKATLRGAGINSPCLADDPVYRFCVGKAGVDLTFAFGEIFKRTGPIPEGVNCLVEVFKMASAAVAKVIAFITTAPTIFCNLQPVLLDYFTATPRPGPTLPVGRQESVLIQAHLTALYTKQTAADELIDQATTLLLSEVKGIKACASLFGKVSTDVVPKLFAGQYEWIQDHVGKIISQQQRVADVYRCDLDTVRPVNRQLMTEGDPFFNDSNGTYRFRGKRDGATEVEIYTVSGNFIHVPRVRNLFGKRSTAAAFRRAPVIVGRSRYLSVLRTVYPVTARTVAGLPLEKLVTDGSGYSPAPYSGPWGTYRHKVTKFAGRNAWQIEASGQPPSTNGGARGDVDVLFALSPNRRNTQRIRITATASSAAEPIAPADRVTFTNLAGGSASASAGSVTQSQFSLSAAAFETRRSAGDSKSIDAAGADNGYVHTTIDTRGPGTARVKVLIELLDR